MTTAADPNTQYWKRHDTAPAALFQIQDPTGAAINLTGCTVKFIMVALVGGTPKISAAATIVNPLTGVVSYQPLSTDTDTAGAFLAEWEVTYATGNKQTFPDPGYIPVVITADLDNA